MTLGSFSSKALLAVACIFALLLTSPADARRRKRKREPKKQDPPAEVVPEIVEVQLGPALWPLTESDAPRVLLLPVVGAGMEPGPLQELSRAVAAELAARPRLHLEGGVGATSLLQAELGDGAAACVRDVECAAELAGAFGARYALAGTVDLVEGARLTAFTLIDADSGEVAARPTRMLEGGEDLDGHAKGTALLALRPLLEEGQATLTVRGTPGAEVRLDGELLGTLPLVGRAVTAGPHLLEVSAQGFMPLSRVVELTPGGGLEVDGGLAPGAALLEEGKSSASSGGLLAWSAVGGGALVAVAGGAGLGFSLWRADEVNRAIRDANAKGGVTAEQKAAFDQDALIVHVVTGAGATLLVVGGALVATGASLLWFGADPEPAAP